jgi:hypothetical protein
MGNVRFLKACCIYKKRKEHSKAKLNQYRIEIIVKKDNVICTIVNILL